MTLPALPTQPAPRQIATTVNAMLQGSTNATGSVTLTPSSSTTVVLDPRAGATSVILLCPMSATAAIAPIWVSARTDASFTLTHDSMAALDRTYTYEIRNG